MRLTPLDIRNKEFHRGMRGYVDAEVDEFLDAVADEYERVFKEGIELTERLEALQEQLSHYRSIEETLQKTLLSAQQSAEEMRGAAARESQLVIKDAEVKARDLLGEATSVKQQVERETVLLQNAQADFRFKFRALLEGYLKQLEAGERTGKPGEGDFQRQADALRAAIAAESRPAGAQTGVQDTEAAAAPGRAGAVAGAAAAPPVPQGVGGGAASQPPTSAASPITTGSPPPPAAPVPRRESEPRAMQTAPQSSPASVPQSAPRPAPAPAPAVAGQEEEGADTASLRAPQDGPARSLEQTADDFFGGVDDKVGGNEFKW